MRTVCKDDHSCKYDGNKQPADHGAEIDGQEIIRLFACEFFDDIQRGQGEQKKKQQHQPYLMVNKTGQQKIHDKHTKQHDGSKPVQCKMRDT